jgi:hypothetical protein
MASTKFKLPVSLAKFPFLYAKASRSVVLGSSDVANRSPLSLYGNSANVDYNIPQMLFCENMWPSDTGMFSVGLEFLNTATVNSDFDRAIVLRDSLTGFALFSPANGKNYFYRPSYGGWLQKNAIVPTVANGRVTTAFVDGRTFIFYEKQTMFEWIWGTDSLNGTAVTWPAGVANANILGICAAGNYLIAYGEEAIYWSSLSNPMDFAAPNSGAGNQIPNQLRGPIRTVEPFADGFIIYTNRNAVAAQATNDATRPWAFREIRDCGGLEGQEQVTADSPASGHYTVGAYGLQFVTTQRAESVLPDAADFLVGREIELWNYSTKRIEGWSANLDRYPRLNFIDGRYLFISYGWKDGAYQLALMYDLQLQRWGKIRCPHVDICALAGLSMFSSLDAGYTAAFAGSQRMLRENILLLQPNGELQRIIPFSGFRVPFALPTRHNSNGVVIFGHIKLTRGRWATFQKLLVDGVRFFVDPTGAYPIPEAYILPALRDMPDATTTPYQLTAEYTAGRSAAWVGRYTADSFDLCIEGRMDLTTVQVEVTGHGSR